MKTIKIHKDKNTFEIDGEHYPPTRHNLEVWREYQRTKNEDVLKRLSTVVLDLEVGE